ncbi:hypothetical protein J6590_046326 [Homalodisca vitripennis]|nr:hypothetical protein J6590_046326 [Homalodisca vitripennis]
MAEWSKTLDLGLGSKLEIAQVLILSVTFVISTIDLDVFNWRQKLVHGRVPDDMVQVREINAWCSEIECWCADRTQFNVFNDLVGVCSLKSTSRRMYVYSIGVWWFTSGWEDKPLAPSDLPTALSTTPFKYCLVIHTSACCLGMHLVGGN